MHRRRASSLQLLCFVLFCLRLAHVHTHTRFRTSPRSALTLVCSVLVTSPTASGAVVAPMASPTTSLAASGDNAIFWVALASQVRCYCLAFPDADPSAPMTSTTPVATITKKFEFSLPMPVLSHAFAAVPMPFLKAPVTTETDTPSANTESVDDISVVTTWALATWSTAANEANGVSLEVTPAIPPWAQFAAASNENDGDPDGDAGWWHRHAVGAPSRHTGGAWYGEVSFDAAGADVFDIVTATRPALAATSFVPPAGASLVRAGGPVAGFYVSRQETDDPYTLWAINLTTGTYIAAASLTDNLAAGERVISADLLLAAWKPTTASPTQTTPSTTVVTTAEQKAALDATLPPVATYVLVKRTLSSAWWDFLVYTMDSHRSFVYAGASPGLGGPFDVVIDSSLARAWIAVLRSPLLATSTTSATASAANLAAANAPSAPAANDEEGDEPCDEGSDPDDPRACNEEAPQPLRRPRRLATARPVPAFRRGSPLPPGRRGTDPEGPIPARHHQGSTANAFGTTGSYEIVLFTLTHSPFQLTAIDAVRYTTTMQAPIVRACAGLTTVPAASGDPTVPDEGLVLALLTEDATGNFALTVQRRTVTPDLESIRGHKYLFAPEDYPGGPPFDIGLVPSVTAHPGARIPVE